MKVEQEMEEIDSDIDWDNSDNNSVIGDDETYDVIVNYKIHTSREIKSKQDSLIKYTMELLNFSEDDAIIILKQLKWNSNKLNDLDFLDHVSIKSKFGITLNSEDIIKDQSLWGIWYREFKPQKFDSLNWRHKFWNKWWEDYLVSQISSGYSMKCFTWPQFKWPLVVPHSLYLKYLPKELVATYEKYLLKSYIDETKNFKNCPTPNCEYVIESMWGLSISFTCKWEKSYWFKWLQIMHRPLAWDNALKWIMKNVSEAENMKWMLVYTKAWPNWWSPIEKNKGWNHMTWDKCRFEFCWMWLGDWAKHNNETGGYYKWNKYIDSLKNPIEKKNLQEKEKMKTELIRYKWHYERWDNHAKAQTKAIKLREKWIQYSEELMRDNFIPPSDLAFLSPAFDEVIKCREVLKWTYAYGYFLEQNKTQELFLCMQEQLEKNCENLHYYLENDFLDFTNEENDFLQFKNLKEKIQSTLASTKRYYENIIDRLENDSLLES